MSKEELTLEKAIASITKAAEELSVDEFIDYSVILNVHIDWSLEALTADEQHEFLQALKGILEKHEDLAQAIGWDLVLVLLPYLDSSSEKTVEITEWLIDYSARVGNPREVYIKVLQGISSLSWLPESLSDDEDEGSDTEGEQEAATHSDDEEESAIPKKSAPRQQDPVVFAKHALRRFTNLLSALSTVHPRISARFPSKFLSTELSTLLIAFTRAVETTDREEITEVIEHLLAFLRVVRPQLAQTRRKSTVERPPLPPRTSTCENVGQGEDYDEEEKLQIRLIASFLSHVLSGYLRRSKRAQRNEKKADEGSDVHPAIRDEERGLEVGWAGKYDEEVLRPKTSKVPGGKTLIDVEREQRAARSHVKETVEEISLICERLGLTVEDLLHTCLGESDPASDEEDHTADIPAPKSAEEVPLSKEGALFLLANRLSADLTSSNTTLQIYPSHAAIAESYMVYGTGQSDPAVIDAILFLGLFSLETGGIGDIPADAESFFIYLQIFSVISTNSSSAQQRYLAHAHVARCLRAHPEEAVRLAYVKDTLEHCPFESVKAGVVGILKDEIFHANTPALREGSSVPSTPVSIFGTSLCITELLDVLFPDMETLLEGEKEKQWDRFKDLFPRYLATLNLVLALLKNREIRGKMGFENSGLVEKVERRFLEPARKRVEVFREMEGKEGETGNVGMLEMNLEWVKEAMLE